MKCPNDQSEMEKGLIVDRGDKLAKVKLQWAEKINWDSITLSGAVNTIAYKCPKCGKVDLYTETDKEEEQQ